MSSLIFSKHSFVHHVILVRVLFHTGHFILSLLTLITHLKHCFYFSIKGENPLLPSLLLLLTILYLHMPSSDYYLSICNVASAMSLPSLHAHSMPGLHTLSPCPVSTPTLLDLPSRSLSILTLHALFPLPLSLPFLHAHSPHQVSIPTLHCRTLCRLSSPCSRHVLQSRVVSPGPHHTCLV